MIHGGLRYLENAEFKLVSEAVVDAMIAADALGRQRKKLIGMA